MKNDHLTTASNSSWGDGTIASVRRWVSSSTGLGIIFILAKRDIVYALNHIHFYLQLSIACLIPALYVKSYLDYITNNGTLVLNAPYRMPLLLTVSLMTFFLESTALYSLLGRRKKELWKYCFMARLQVQFLSLGN